VQQDLLNQPCSKAGSSSGVSTSNPAVCDDVLQFLEHPSVASERQQGQQQQLKDDICRHTVAQQVATVQQAQSPSSPFCIENVAGNMHNSSSSSGSSTEEQANDADGAPDAAAAAIGDDAAAAGDLTAAASTWAMEIRHFTDCLPITPDSVCSSSTYLSLTGAQQHTQKQQQQQAQQEAQRPRHSNQAAAAARTCSLPHSSSSTSLPQRCSSDGDAAAAATEAALQASLAALQELDDVEWCPWDRVSKWLESHAAAAAGNEQQAMQPRSMLEHATSSSSSSSSGYRLLHASSSSLTAGGGGLATEEQQRQQGVDDEPVFDAPAWWQEAVLERLEQQRQAFQGSWWSRARVLASLAANRAACALQI
jgi:hypothetical protein